MVTQPARRIGRHHGFEAGGPLAREARRIPFQPLGRVLSCPRPIMQSVSNDSFGPLIAYLVPGATALYGLSPFLPAVRAWFGATPGDAPTIGGFLFLTVAALAVGMTVSAVRWATVDQLHARTGLPPPPLDFARLGVNAEAFQLLIDIHYRHYQFYANMFVATAAAWVAHRTVTGWTQPAESVDVAILILEPVFLLTSRDTLRKYYARTRQLLSPRSRQAPTV